MFCFTILGATVTRNCGEDQPESGVLAITDKAGWALSVAWSAYEMCEYWAHAAHQRNPAIARALSCD